MEDVPATDPQITAPQLFMCQGLGWLCKYAYVLKVSDRDHALRACGSVLVCLFLIFTATGENYTAA